MESTTPRIGEQRLSGPNLDPKTGLTSSILTHEVKSVPKCPQTRENSDLEHRLSRAAAHVKESREFLPYVWERDHKRAEKLEACGSWLLFHHYLKLQEFRLASGIFCQQPLLCGFCAAGRAARQSQTLSDKIGHIQEEHRFLVPYMVTLTMKGQRELPPMIEKFWGAYSGLIQRRRNARKGKNDSVMGVMAGGFMAGEAKRGQGGEWHYHGHGIWLADVTRYQPVWKRLVREWAAQLGQSHASVQFEPVAKGGTADAIREACKYASKFEPGAYADRWEAAQALERVRRIRTFGNLFGLKLPEEVADDLSDVEAQEYIERAFSYGASGYYEVPVAQREPAFDEWNEEGRLRDEQADKDCPF